MKPIFYATTLALAALAAPQAAFAQADEAPAGSIIVSGEFQKDWNKGNKLEAEGLGELQKAKDSLVRYSADVVNAQDLRDTSQDRADNARLAFEALTQRPYFSSPEEARKWAKQVEDAASDWEKYQSRRDEGAKDLVKAQKKQADAQEDVTKAERKIEKGRSLMAEAERSSMRVSMR